jgi:hypothetical protein
MKAKDIEIAISKALNLLLPRIVKKQKKDGKMKEIEKPTGKSVMMKEPVTLFGKQRGRRK